MPRKKLTEDVRVLCTQEYTILLREIKVDLNGDVCYVSRIWKLLLRCQSLHIDLSVQGISVKIQLDADDSKLYTKMQNGWNS